MPDPEKRVALVTGGAKGIGAAISLRLAADGFDVVVGGRSAMTTREYAVRILARSITFDVGDSEAVFAAIESVGPIDVLVNNAGWEHFGLFTEVPIESWKRVLAVNLEGVISCTQAALPGMQRRGWGRGSRGAGRTRRGSGAARCRPARAPARRRGRRWRAWPWCSAKSRP